jgi:hypothetical protein
MAAREPSEGQQPGNEAADPTLGETEELRLDASQPDPVRSKFISNGYACCH